MHAHGTRLRKPVGEVPIDIRRYTCPGCGGVVQVLPSFIARHLWWAWEAVEGACAEVPEQVVPLRTRRRWWARCRLPARQLLHVLSSMRQPKLVELVASIGLGATQRALLTAFAAIAGPLGACASLAILINLWIPGLRVM